VWQSVVAGWQCVAIGSGWVAVGLGGSAAGWQLMRLGGSGWVAVGGSVWQFDGSATLKTSILTQFDPPQTSFYT
jgi:hypothetical protein